MFLLVVDLAQGRRIDLRTWALTDLSRGSPGPAVTPVAKNRGCCLGLLACDDDPGFPRFRCLQCGANWQRDCTISSASARLRRPCCDGCLPQRPVAAGPLPRSDCLFVIGDESVPGTSVIGLQWGDEAKGKLVDLLTDSLGVDVVVRYQGGANAGHTVVIGDVTYKLHQIPSGILSEGVKNLITPGVVFHPATVLKEIDGLNARGIPVSDRLLISERAHVVFPWHIAEDRALNADKIGGESIGTTLRGIGPCYRDKYGRMSAIRLGDMVGSSFRQQIEHAVVMKRRALAGYGDLIEKDELDVDRIYEEYQPYAERLAPMVGDTTQYLLDAVEADKRILFEGAQGAMLDIDHGTFPFVTSSNSSGVGVSAGSGVPGRWISRVYGVIKAYSTRVGGGPFPTELDNQVGQQIRDLGNEYGTTTGRPRRCGWFDAVAVRYAARLSGVDVLSLMMMDVVSQLPEINICIGYELDGRRIDYVPSQMQELRRVVPIYETIPGWQTDVSQARTLAQLPAGAHRFIQRIGELVGCPVEILSVGPGRAQTIRLVS
jgi:adenylosuccinate synthase